MENPDDPENPYIVETAICAIADATMTDSASYTATEAEEITIVVDLSFLEVQFKVIVA